VQGRQDSPATTEIDHALAYLESQQLPSGEFLVLRGRIRELSDGVELRSIFGTALVARALMRHTGNDRANRALERARAFLRAEREPNGLWRYFGRGSSIPPDADDTACALLVLPPDPDDRLVMEALLRNRDRSGAVRTWFLGRFDRRRRNIVDAVVSANVYTLLCERSVPAPTLRDYLEMVLFQRGFSSGSPYYPSPLVFLNVMAGVAETLSAEAAARIEAEVLDLVPRVIDGPIIEVALACSALDAHGPSNERVRNRLQDCILAEQRDDGGWGADGLWGDQAPHLKRAGRRRKATPPLAWYGSRALTTAFCVQALTSG
jgi:hypothetical protein